MFFNVKFDEFPLINSIIRTSEIGLYSQAGGKEVLRLSSGQNNPKVNLS